MRGGVVWGISAALREISEVDPRYGGFLNADVADYVIPVNADIGTIEVDFIDELDPVLNTTGVKGLGEVCMVGAAPAIANAVHHATGQRVRDLPIRLEHLVWRSAERGVPNEARMLACGLPLAVGSWRNRDLSHDTRDVRFPETA